MISSISATDLVCVSIFLFAEGQSILPSLSLNLSEQLRGLMKVKGCGFLTRRRQLNTHITESDAVPLSKDKLDRISKIETSNSRLKFYNAQLNPLVRLQGVKYVIVVLLEHYRKRLPS